MSEMSLKARITDNMKEAMRARNKERLGAIRLILADIKRIEVDERIELDDARIVALLDKMCKQRRDSAKQYHEAGREELAAIEENELAIIQEFMPSQLSEQDLQELIESAIKSTGASSMKEMGQIMAILKPQVQGRVDMADVSKRIKSILTA